MKDLLFELDETTRKIYIMLNDFLIKNNILDINGKCAYIVLKLGKETINISNLNKFKVYSGSNADYSIKTLEKYCYISTEIPKKDHRMTMVKITDKGLALKEKLEEFFEKMEKETDVNCSLIADELKKIRRYENE